MWSSKLDLSEGSRFRPQLQKFFLHNCRNTVSFCSYFTLLCSMQRKQKKCSKGRKWNVTPSTMRGSYFVLFAAFYFSLLGFNALLVCLSSFLYFLILVGKIKLVNFYSSRNTLCKIVACIWNVGQIRLEVGKDLHRKSEKTWLPYFISKKNHPIK